MQQTLRRGERGQQNDIRYHISGLEIAKNKIRNHTFEKKSVCKKRAICTQR
jgi:hypothetical protein